MRCSATDKHIWLLSNYGNETIVKLDCPSQFVTALAFNHNDSVLSFTSSDGFHQRYDLVHLKKRNEAFIDRTLEYRGVVFLQDQSDEVKCVSVGQVTRTGGNLRIFNKDDIVEDQTTIKDRG